MISTIQKFFTNSLGELVVYYIDWNNPTPLGRGHYQWACHVNADYNGKNYENTFKVTSSDSSMYDDYNGIKHEINDPSPLYLNEWKNDRLYSKIEADVEDWLEQL